MGTHFYGVWKDIHPKGKVGPHRCLFPSGFDQATQQMLDFCLLVAYGGQVFLNYVIKVIKQGYFKKHGLCKVRLPWEFLTVVQSQDNYLRKSCLACAFAFLHCLIKRTPTLTPPSFCCQVFPLTCDFQVLRDSVFFGKKKSKLL